MNKLILALVSAGIFGFVTFWIAAWILMKCEDRWPSNDLTGKGLPSGCWLVLMAIITFCGASVGFWLSWGGE